MIQLQNLMYLIWVYYSGNYPVVNHPLIMKQKITLLKLLISSLISLMVKEKSRSLIQTVNTLNFTKVSIKL
jgi:hypothetical protein